MGRGEAKRRREKNAQAAKHGKLSKVKMLPEAKEGPTGNNRRKGKKRKGADTDDENAGLPRKLRELMKLKEFAKQQEAKAKAAESQPAESNAEGETSDQTRALRAATPDAAKKTQAPSRARQKKKEWKRMKKQKLMEKKDRAMEPNSDDGEWEATTKAKPVRFGEVAAQPPTFNLKQRHWDPEQKSSRIKDIFAKQMNDAKRAARNNTAIPDVGAMSEHDAALRLQLIEGYRQSRRSGGGGSAATSGKARGPATLQSLKSLVQASAGRGED